MSIFTHPTFLLRFYFPIPLNILSINTYCKSEMLPDAAAFRNYNAATNWSIIRNIAINLAHLSGYNSLTKAERFLAHDIDKLFLLLE